MAIGYILVFDGEMGSHLWTCFSTFDRCRRLEKRWLVVASENRVSAGETTGLSFQFAGDRFHIRLIFNLR